MRRGCGAASIARSRYARPPSPHRVDTDAFTEALMRIEPSRVTVRQVVEMFDGCTGATAGKLADPFGKRRLARSMSDAEAATLLASTQAIAREVKHTALCPIGPGAFDSDDYARATRSFPVACTGRAPRSRLWSRRGSAPRRARASHNPSRSSFTYVNRTPG
jgi:hypothetical protein